MSRGEAAAGGTRPPAAAPWQNPWLWLALAVLSALPFLVAPLPMQPDWFSHVGRYHVMNASGDAYLSLYYAFDWTLAGNATLLHQGRVWPPMHLLGAALAGAALVAL